jgi:membrane-associated phospholipid phosphatase
VLAFTRCGEHGLLWQAVAGLGAALDRDRRSLYLRAVRVVFGAYVANIAMKYAVRRARPRLEGLPPLSSTVTGLSYPSAHSTTSFAAARVLRGALPAGMLYATAGAMAVSRPYVGVHYPSDCLAGAALGTALAELIP